LAEVSVLAVDLRQPSSRFIIDSGLLGVRIIENRNNRRRSIFVHKDEITWLVGALEVAAEVDTSEVFWDQTRAGYIRLITQRCANKHGRFLIIEEYDGRRRSGSILCAGGEDRTRLGQNDIRAETGRLTNEDGSWNQRL
jgi:hypothetical protein